MYRIYLKHLNPIFLTTNHLQYWQVPLGVHKPLVEVDVSPFGPTSEWIINEWFASEENPEAARPRPVTVAPLDAALDIPSLESLWFSAEPEDGQRRLRAFLACMKANDDAGILDKDKIPRQYLVPCVVLRYILEYGKETGKPLLTKAELEAFLATAVCPMMRNVRVTK